MPAGYSFRPRFWALALAAAACAAGIGLGNWQAGRAAEKRALGERAERMRASGTFVVERVVLLDNKQRRGRVGYEVIMPLKLAGSDLHLLVNRGWIEAPRRREVLPEVRTPAGKVELEGVVLDRLPRIYSLTEKEKGKVRQTLDIAAFAAETGLKLQPLFLEQHSALDDGLLREWIRPDAGAGKNESYALQWYSLAALAMALGLVFSFRKK